MSFTAHRLSRVFVRACATGDAVELPAARHPTAVREPSPPTDSTIFEPLIVDGEPLTAEVVVKSDRRRTTALFLTRTLSVAARIEPRAISWPLAYHAAAPLALFIDRASDGVTIAGARQRPTINNEVVRQRLVDEAVV